MRHRRRMGIGLSLVASLALVAAACGSSAKTSSSAPTTAAGGGATTTAAGGGGTGKCKSGTATVPPIPTAQASGQGKTIGMMFDVTGRGDKSFNDAAAAALDKAKTDFGITGNESTPTSP